MADLTAELEESNREAFRGLHPVEEEEDLDAKAEATLESETFPEEGGQLEGANGEVLGSFTKPSFPAETAVKTAP